MSNQRGRPGPNRQFYLGLGRNNPFIAPNQSSGTLGSEHARIAAQNGSILMAFLNPLDAAFRNAIEFRQATKGVDVIIHVPLVNPVPRTSPDHGMGNVALQHLLGDLAKAGLYDGPYHDNPMAAEAARLREEASRLEGTDMSRLSTKDSLAGQNMSRTRATSAPAAPRKSSKNPQPQSAKPPKPKVSVKAVKKDKKVTGYSATVNGAVVIVPTTTETQKGMLPKIPQVFKADDFSPDIVNVLEELQKPIVEAYNALLKASRHTKKTATVKFAAKQPDGSVKEGFVNAAHHEPVSADGLAEVEKHYRVLHGLVFALPQSASAHSIPVEASWIQRQEWTNVLAAWTTWFNYQQPDPAVRALNKAPKDTTWTALNAVRMSKGSESKSTTSATSATPASTPLCTKCMVAGCSCSEGK